MKALYVIFCLLLISGILSYGCYIEKYKDENSQNIPKNSSFSGEEDNEEYETPCETLANKIDECAISFCESITYKCNLCNCLLNDGNECKYSYHNNMNICTDEDELLAKKSIEIINCNDVISNLLAICPSGDDPITFCSDTTERCTMGTYGGSCVEYVNSNGNSFYNCSKFCYIIGSSVECNMSESCYPHQNGPLCLPVGEIKTNYRCEYTNDCIQGNVCLGINDSSDYYCLLICVDNSDCPSNQSCIDTGFGYSVCVN